MDSWMIKKERNDNPQKEEGSKNNFSNPCPSVKIKEEILQEEIDLVPTFCTDNPPLQCLAKFCHFRSHSLVTLFWHCQQTHSREQITHSPHNEWFKCKQCLDYKTKRSADLYKHIRHKHTADEKTRWFHCDQCLFKSKYAQNLKAHWRIKHDNKIKWLRCDSCSFKSKSATSLKQHVRLKHGRSACGQCEYKSQFIDNRTKTKSEVKWFNCRQCQYKSKFKYHLTRHELLKHELATNIEWLHCEHCDYTTLLKPSLKRHVGAKHRSEWHCCEHCEFRTGYVSNLKRHREAKHGSGDRVRWFHCGQCEFRSKVAGNLKKHTRTQH